MPETWQSSVKKVSFILYQQWERLIKKINSMPFFCLLLHILSPQLLVEWDKLTVQIQLVSMPATVIWNLCNTHLSSLRSAMQTLVAPTRYGSSFSHTLSQTRERLNSMKRQTDVISLLSLVCFFPVHQVSSASLGSQKWQIKECKEMECKCKRKYNCFKTIYCLQFCTVIYSCLKCVKHWHPSEWAGN